VQCADESTSRFGGKVTDTQAKPASNNELGEKSEGNEKRGPGVSASNYPVAVGGQWNYYFGTSTANTAAGSDIFASGQVTAGATGGVVSTSGSVLPNSYAQVGLASDLNAQLHAVVGTSIFVSNVPDEPFSIKPVVYYVSDPSVSGTTFVPLNTLVVGSQLVSYPAQLQAQLVSDYADLGAALTDLHESSLDDWRIDVPVFSLASTVASALFAHSYPAPDLMTHGPESVVFNWNSADDRSLYLTISKDYISTLLSSPEKIERRLEVPIGVLFNPSLVAPVIEWTRHGRPVVTNLSTPLEFIALY
jgi:hypothetical protein